MNFFPFPLYWTCVNFIVIGRLVFLLSFPLLVALTKKRIIHTTYTHTKSKRSTEVNPAPEGTTETVFFNQEREKKTKVFLKEKRMKKQRN